jgi:2-desacetyl-2-hydroxyethyl bacteriochlorophyllide A dehydrogenase
MSITGRRVVFESKGNAALQSYEVREPADDQVLVEATYGAISPGTERAMLLAEPGTQTARKGYPFYPGYSNVGRVLRVGKAVTEFVPGEYVATSWLHESHIILPASTGPGLPVEKYRQEFSNAMAPGGTVPQVHHVWKIPGAPTAEMQKALSAYHIWAVGLNGVRRAQVDLGEGAIIIGLGSIGLSAAKFAQLSGGFPVIGVDTSPIRRKIAEGFGLDAICADLTEAAEKLKAMTGRSTGPEVVIEATGSPVVIPMTFKACGRGGRVALLGSTRGLTKEVDFYDDVHRKSLTVLGVHESGHPAWENRSGSWTVWSDRDLVLQLTLAGKLPGPLLVSHEFAAEDVGAAYQKVIDDPLALTVAIRW